MSQEQMPAIRVIGFDTTYEMVAKRNEYGDMVLQGEEGKEKPVMVRAEEHWVTFAPDQSPMSTQTKERIRFIKPGNIDSSKDKKGLKRKFMEYRWAQIEPKYNAWVKGHEIPEDGTPLAMWSGLNAAQCEAFRQINIRTVEEIANLNETQIGRIKLPNVRGLKSAAQAYLDSKNGNDNSALVAQMSEDYAAMKEQLAAAMELLEEKTPAPDDEGAEIMRLRAELDEKGIPYHHKAKAAKLTELLNA